MFGHCEDVIVYYHVIPCKCISLNQYPIVLTIISSNITFAFVTVLGILTFWEVDLDKHVWKWEQTFAIG